MRYGSGQSSKKMHRVGGNRTCTPYMTVCMVTSLPKIPYTHRLYVCMYGFGQPYKCSNGMRRRPSLEDPCLEHACAFYAWKQWRVLPSSMLLLLLLLLRLCLVLLCSGKAAGNHLSLQCVCVCVCVCARVCVRACVCNVKQWPVRTGACSMLFQGRLQYTSFICKHTLKSNQPHYANQIT
jgi:hypothetical protein